MADGQKQSMMDLIGMIANKGYNKVLPAFGQARPYGGQQPVDAINRTVGSALGRPSDPEALYRATGNHPSAAPQPGKPGQGGIGDMLMGIYQQYKQQQEQEAMARGRAEAQGGQHLQAAEQQARAGEAKIRQDVDDSMLTAPAIAAQQQMQQPPPGPEQLFQGAGFASPQHYAQMGEAGALPGPLQEQYDAWKAWQMQQGAQ